MPYRALVPGLLILACCLGADSPPNLFGNAVGPQDWSVLPDPAPTASSRPAAGSKFTTPYSAKLQVSDVRTAKGDPVGQFILSTSFDGWQIWDVNNGKITRQVRGGFPLTDPVISDDGQFVAGGLSGESEVWSLRTGRKLVTIPPIEVVPPATAPAPAAPLGRGSTVAERMAANNARARAIQEQQQVRLAAMAEVRTQVVAFSPTNQLLVVNSAPDHTVTARLVDPVSGKELLRFPVPAKPYSVAFSPGGNYLLMAIQAFNHGGVFAFNLKTGQPAGFLGGTGDAVIAFSSDGRQFAIYHNVPSKLTLSLHQAETGEVIRQAEVPQYDGRIGIDRLCLQFRPDGKALLLHNRAFDVASLHQVYVSPLTDLIYGSRWIDDDHLAVMHDAPTGVALDAVTIDRQTVERAATVLAEGGHAEDAVLAPTTPLVRRATREVDLNGALVPGLFRLSATAQAHVTTTSTNLKKTDAPLPFQVAEAPTALLFSGAESHAFFVERAIFTHDRNRNDAFAQSPFARSHTYIDRYDLTASSAASTFEVSPLLRVLDVSPSGKTVAFQGGAGIDRLDVWTEEKGKFAFRFAAQPFGNAASALKKDLKTFTDPHQVIWAACIDDTHVLALSGGSELDLIDLASASVVWHTTLPVDTTRDPWGNVTYHRSMPALSPDRKTIAVATSNAIRFIDTLSGGMANALPLKESGVGASLVFSPDGGRLAAVIPHDSFAQIRAFDLHNGQSLADFPAPVSTPTIDGPLLLTGDDLLFPDGHLFSLANKAPFYLYLLGGGTVMNSNRMAAWPADLHTGSVNPYDRLFYITQGSIGQTSGWHVYNLQIPDPPAVAAAAKIDPATLFAYHPGSVVKLELDVVGDDAFRKSQIEVWKQRLNDNGVKIADDAPLRLHVHNFVNVGPSATLKTDANRLGTHSESVNAHEEMPGYDITLFGANNLVLWHVADKSPPPAPFLDMISRKPGESAQQAWNRDHPSLKEASTILPPPPYIYGATVQGLTHLTDNGPVAAKLPTPK